ncbi:MAG: hypothetical protein M5R42_07880 [Rhodocyclaceae bacterium]|nr:hypothetical protein [Rhodocyclaceae bacterium]
MPARRAPPRRRRRTGGHQRGRAQKYVNRLSDLLFVLGRTLNRLAGHGDVLWQKDRARG